MIGGELSNGGAATRAASRPAISFRLARDREYEIETFMKVLDVNLTGTFQTCMAFRSQRAWDGESLAG
ncbi:hypothetical protein TM239_64390 [Bradyrhizobium sp. TM239]|nr:hypothetical protein TM239_64390 [Bradyrhizobium sp. TM239]